MPTIGLVVLIGAVLLVAAVWLTPIDRAVAKPATEGPSDPGSAQDPVVTRAHLSAPGAQTTAASTAVASEPAALAMPSLAIERLAQPATPVAETSTASQPVVSADAPTSEPNRQVSELPIPVEVGMRNGSTPTAEDPPAPDADEAPTTERPALSATRSAWKPSYTARPARRRKLASVTYPLTSTATDAVDGGAVSRSAYPMAIPIPIAMSVAETPAPVVDPSPAAPPILPLWRAGNDAQVHSSSSNGSSVSWSPHPAHDADVSPAPQVWQGSHSVVARVSSTEPDIRDENVRKGLLIAAGVVVALAVASRR